MRPSNDNVNHSGSEVLDLVHRVMHQVRSQQYQALREGADAVTHMESKVLGFIGHHPGSTQSDLAQHSGRDKAQLARLIKGLRERGLLDGEPDPADRRNLRLQLTDRGRDVLRQLQQQMQQVGRRALAGFSAAELRQLATLLQRLQQNLDDGPH